MKRFTFRLQKVMELRRWNEKSSQQRVAEAQRRRDTARRRLEDAEAEREMQDALVVARMGNAFNAGEALMEFNHSSRLRNEVASSRDSLNDRQEAVADRRQELVNASRDKRVIETLRDRRYTEYQRNESRQEQAVLDEIAGQRHFKRTAGE